MFFLCQTSGANLAYQMHYCLEIKISTVMNIIYLMYIIISHGISMYIMIEVEKEYYGFCNLVKEIKS